MMGDELYAACEAYGEKLAKVANSRGVTSEEADALLSEGIPLAVGLLVDIAASLDMIAQKKEDEAMIRPGADRGRRPGG